ncbi:MAG: protein BatD [Deltaproteobacteria bacterium]|nr:protein BatD [Deltaproteobacteria bacterium]
MKKTVSCLILLLLFLWLPVFGVRAEVSVSLKLDRSEVSEADSIRMLVSVSGSGKHSSDPVIKGVDSFYVTKGGTSSRVEIINGQMNSGIDFTYFLQPGKTGIFHIGPAEISIGGKIYRSNIAELNVVKSSLKQGDDGGEIFLVPELSADRAVVDEQVIFTLKLYRRINIRDISLDLPEQEHLHFTQLGNPTEYKTTINNRSLQVLEVRYAVTASEAKEYPIGPVRMNMTVLQGDTRSPGGLFNDPFFSFSTGRPLTLSCETLLLKVDNLPEEGRPADFSGLVGDFELESGLEPSTIKAGESATLTVKIKGRGNVKLIPDFQIPELEKTKIYADRPVLETTQDRSGLGGLKTMKWAIVPEKDGDLEIPALTLSYYDPKTGRYMIVKAGPHFLNVLPGEGQETLTVKGAEQVQGAQGRSKQAVREIGRDILPIHTSIKDFDSSTAVQPITCLIRVIIISPMLLYLGIFLTVRFRNRFIKNLVESKARNARKAFQKAYGPGKLCSDDLITAVRDYLNDRLNLQLGSITADEVYEILKSKGVRDDPAEVMREFIMECENSVYTGKGRETFRGEFDLMKLIKRIDKELG